MVFVRSPLRADPLTKMTMEMVSHTLGTIKVQQFREEFQVLDTSHTGRLGRKDFFKSFHGCDVSSCCPLTIFLSL
jgi:Ca2+-binding EF-hand superfamily protein